ncbi:MAG: guanylate kinase [Pirellulales bacterium]|nr:guanylate kinase [Pirellulales bacterium]
MTDDTNTTGGNAATKNGKVVIVSGPSGAGKTTVMRRVFEKCPLPLRHSVSATTRPPRAGELDGRDYYFLAPEDFDARRKRGEFLECFAVFGRDYWYGTLWSEIRKGFAAGEWVVLEIDVQGALAAMERFPDALSIFIRPGSFAELEKRLRGRGTESEEALERRLERAKHELKLADRYRHQVINDDLDRAVAEICDILTSEREKKR